MKHASLLLLICTPCAFAQDWESSYSYIGVDYAQLDVDVLGTTLDADGFALEGSAALADHVHVFGTHASATSDDLSADVTYQEQSVGLGVHFNLQRASVLVQPAVSVFARIGYIDGEIEVDGLGSLSDDGITRSFGIRLMPGPRSEFRGAVEYVDIDSTRSGTAVSIGGDIYIGESSALRLGYIDYLDEDAEALTVGVRFYFGNSAAD